MTDEKNIKQLLEAFYNGSTSIEEEILLLNFFNDDNLNEQWHTDRDLFNVLYSPSEISLPKGFSERLENAVDKHIDKTYRENSRRKTRKLFMNIGSAAAIALLCIGLFFVTDKPAPTQAMNDTFTNPEEAAIVAEQVLMLVSSNLNKGLSSLEKAREGIDRTSELLNENLSLN